MKRLPLFLSHSVSSDPLRNFRRSSSSAFTLMELLVAITVLVIMMIFLAQMLSSASQTWIHGKGRVDNFSKARALLDLLASDLQNGIYRSDLASFPGTNIAFYTKRAGIPTTTSTNLRNISLVQYTLGTATNPTTLERADMAILLTDPATNISFGNTNTLNTNNVTSRGTAAGVVGFEVLFLGTNGMLSTNSSSTNGLRGFAIGLAVVDADTLIKLSSSQISSLQAALQSPAALTGTNSIKADWENYLTNGMNWSAFPPPLGWGLKIFERYVYLP